MVRAVVLAPKGAANEMPVVAESHLTWGAAETRTSANLRLCRVRSPPATTRCRNCGSSDEDRADDGSGEPKS
jgi:hypothetical protein